jgi:PAS domain S-box-containing protein
MPATAPPPGPPASAPDHRRRLLVALGVALVVLFLVGELLLVRSYEKTARTTRGFQRATDVSNELANAQREALIATQAVARLKGGDPTLAVLVRRGLLERHVDVVQHAAPDDAALQRHVRIIRADIARFDTLFAAAYGSGTRVHPGPGGAQVHDVLARLERDIKHAFDDEEHNLYGALGSTLDQRADDQLLVVVLSAFALLMAAGLAIIIRRAIRGDFARAQGMLESSEARFQQLVEQLPAIVYALSLPDDGGTPQPVYVSPQMMAITGVSAEETMRRGLKWLGQHVPEQDRRRVGAAIAAGATGGAVPPVDFAFVKPDGYGIWLRATSAAVTHGPEGPRLQGLIFDVTEAKRAQSDHERMEAELRLAQKLEAVGQLAAGIAHEINTPIQFVGDTVRFLQEAFGDLLALQPVQDEVNRAAAAGPVPAELLARVHDAEEQADLDYLRERVPGAFARASDGLGRVAAIVGAMREFAHPPTTEQAPVDVNDALRNTLIVAANAYKYIAEVTTELGDLPPVVCNGGDMNQVFLNLIVNAAHAIEDRVGDSGGRGTITIATRRDGDNVIVSIADSGGGIPAEIASRIFDPFFTTKDVGRGTGQGLAIARTMVVERHGGTLTFDSEPGHGTTFHVGLPIAGLQPAVEQARAA